MKEFKPTYLSIKQHSLTGLKYFCKTTGTEKYLLQEYKGSGDYWKDHLKIHGRKYVETIWYCLFTEKDELVKFALMCSEQWNIVDARDANDKKLWANEKPENGLDGRQPGLKFGPQSEQHKANNAQSQKGKHSGVSVGRTHS